MITLQYKTGDGKNYGIHRLVHIVVHTLNREDSHCISRVLFAKPSKTDTISSFCVTTQVITHDTNVA